MMHVPVKPWQTALVLTLLTGWYLAATLPFLADFPRLDWAQMGIAAPAWKLADEGVYGNDLFAGFHRSERRNYEYMPAYPVLVALSFKVFGLGVLQARWVSVLCGWLAVMLTFRLGRLLHGTTAGLVAATLVCTLRPGLVPRTSGIALIDFARLIRYDVLVPVFVLAASICCVQALRSSGSSSRFTTAVGLTAAGCFAGLAALAHVYGAFILPVLIAAALWHRGRPLSVNSPRGLALCLLLGFLLALLPWVFYVAQDFEAYVGQMSRHQGRFDLLAPSFYLDNLVREPLRYAAWSGGSLASALLRPRVGIWLILLLVPVSTLLLWRRCRRPEARLADRFLFLALPLLELGLALLIVLKRYYYTALVWPFIALQLGFLAAAFQRWATDRGRLTRLVLPAMLALTFLEGAHGVARVHREGARTTSYRELTEAIAGSIPRGSRILVSQPYWLGLKLYGHADLRSLNHLFLFPETLSMAAVMDRFRADYVVLESYFLERQPTDPRAGGDNPRTRQVFLALGAYLRQSCAGDVVRHPSADYGTVEVWDCSGSFRG